MRFFAKENNKKTYSIMAKYIQILGYVLIIIGAILIALSMTMGWNNSNIINFGSVILIIAGIITYIFASKKILGEDINNK